MKYMWSHVICWFHMWPHVNHLWSHIFHMWCANFTCRPLYTTCEKSFHMWLEYFHMWNTCDKMWFVDFTCYLIYHMWNWICSHVICMWSHICGLLISHMINKTPHATRYFHMWYRPYMWSHVIYIFHMLSYMMTC